MSEGILMKHVVWKWFINVEKEEKWLNLMADKGFQLTSFRFGRYVFNQDKENQYTYKIDLLKQPLHYPKGKAYLAFLAEQQVEYICHSMQWIYVRQIKSNEPFQLYTDITSTIEYTKRIQTFYIMLACAMLVIGISTFTTIISLFTASSSSSNAMAMINVTLGSILIMLSFLFLVNSISYSKLIKKLEKEILIRS